jgi:hypothetical protein
VARQLEAARQAGAATLESHFFGCNGLRIAEVEVCLAFLSRGHLTSGCLRMNRWPLVVLACLASAPSCSSYEPQGQFWPAESGPLTLGAGAAPAQSGMGNAAAGASGSGGSSVGIGGTGDSVAGSSSASGGSSVAGSQSIAGSTSVAGSSFGGTNSAGGGGSSFGGTHAAAGTSSAGGTTSQSCSLHVTVTTTAPGGNYKPRNVGAIWVADSTGRFVKSLEVWGNQRLSRVVAWNSATRNAGVAGNKVDAITSATLSMHRTHDVTWNCRDYKQQAVPDGTYRVYFEVEDSNSAGPNIFETFNKGSMASTMSASMGNFQGISLTFTP